MEKKTDNLQIQQLTHERSRKIEILKWMRTFAMVSAWISMGLYSEVSSPTLPYLKQRVNSNYEEISRVMVARAVGFLVGALGGGVLCDRLADYCDLWFAMAQIIAAIGVGCAPFCQSLYLLGAMFFMDGFAKGIIAAGSSSVILRLWGEKAAPPTHALHFGFGVGALIVPQIARPFLPKEEIHDEKNINSENITMSPHQNTTSFYNMSSTVDYSQSVDPPIEIPYGIVSAITAFVGVWLLVLFFCRIKSPQMAGRSDEKKSPKMSCSRFRNVSSIGFAFVFCLCVFWILPTGAERAYGRFIYAYSIEGPHKLSTGDGTAMETLFWATFTGTRMLTIGVSYWVSASVLISGSLALSVVVSTVLAFLSQNHVIVLWVFNCAFGVVLAPVLPASIAWADKYITMTAMMTALAFIASAVGAFIFSWLSGSLYQSEGPGTLMILLVAYSVACTGAFAILYLLGRKKGPRRRDREKADNKLNEQELDDLKSNTA